MHAVPDTFEHPRRCSVSTRHWKGATSLLMCRHSIKWYPKRPGQVRLHLPNKIIWRSNDVENRLVEFVRVNAQRRWNKTVMLANLVVYIFGTAKTGFQTHDNENNLESWDTLCTAISYDTTIVNKRVRLFTKRLTSCSQREGRSFTTYIQ